MGNVGYPTKIYDGNVDTTFRGKLFFRQEGFRIILAENNQIKKVPRAVRDCPDYILHNGDYGKFFSFKGIKLMMVMRNEVKIYGHDCVKPVTITFESMACLELEQFTKRVIWKECFQQILDADLGPILGPHYLIEHDQSYVLLNKGIPEVYYNLSYIDFTHPDVDISKARERILVWACKIFRKNYAENVAEMRARLRITGQQLVSNKEIMKRYYRFIMDGNRPRLPSKRWKSVRKFFKF